MSWIRYRFHTTSCHDYRPVVFDKRYPWWCTGHGGNAGAGEEEYAIIVAYLPHYEHILVYWPDAEHVTSETREQITFTDRFPKPDWFEEEKKEEVVRSVPAYAKMLLASYRALSDELQKRKDLHPFAFSRTMRNRYSGAIDVLKAVSEWSLEKQATHLVKLQSLREAELSQQRKLRQPGYARTHHRVPDVLEQIEGALFAIDLVEKGWDDFYNYLPKFERHEVVGQEKEPNQFGVDPSLDRGPEAQPDAL